MHYGIIIGIQFTRELREDELTTFIGDLNSFKKHARVSGKIRGMDNYIFNLYDETEYNEASDKFSGGLRIYVETESREDMPVDDIKLVCDHYEAAINQLVRKWIV